MAWCRTDCKVALNWSVALSYAHVLCARLFITWTTLITHPTLHFCTLYRQTKASTVLYKHSFIFSTRVNLVKQDGPKIYQYRRRNREPNCRFCKKSLISGKRINTVPVVGVSRNKTLLVDSGQDSVVLAQAFDCSRFPLVQGESFSDLSCLTCAHRAVRLASSVSNSTSPCNERTWNAKGTDTITTSPERERPPPRTSTKKSTALRSPTGITPLGIYPAFIAIKEGGRPTRRLPHAKMLPVSISFFLCSVDYALEGSIFSLSKYDFSR